MLNWIGRCGGVVLVLLPVLARAQRRGVRVGARRQPEDHPVPPEHSGAARVCAAADGVGSESGGE